MRPEQQESRPQSKAILLVSTHGPDLKSVITSNISEQALVVDLLADQGRLFDQLAKQRYALLIIDLALLVKVSKTEPFFPRLQDVSADTATLLIATTQERDLAVDQLRQGGTDYIFVPINPVELSLKIERVLDVQALIQRFDPTSVDSVPDELLMLHQASQEISRTLQLDEALKIVLSKAYDLTQAELAKIYLTDKEGTLSRNKTFAKTSPLVSKAREESLLFGLANRAAFTQEVVCLQKSNDPAWRDQSLQSVLIIPMISREKLVGVLALGSEHSPSFSSNQIRWLSVFCDQAAIAIENAGLFQDLSSAYINLAKNREKIISSRNTLRALFDGISDGVYVLDREMTVNVINQIEAERQGHHPSELVGQSFLSLNWPKAAPELLDRINESLETGRNTTWISPETESEPYLKDREFRIYPIRNRLAQIEQVIVFAQDVSERRLWQVSLFRSANLAAVGQLAGSVAHQINNPLTITMTNSQLLLLETPPESEAYELATDIFKAGERIQNIVTNLLEFSNQETYFFTLTDLIDTIEGALDLVSRSLKKAHIKVIKDYQAKVTLSASISHLKLVWMNLLLNARDAVKDHANEPCITISTRMVSDRLIKVSIVDNGSGIAEKDLDQVFRPFFTTKSPGRALGLGLYSAHTIVERHNGQLKAASQPGIATTFDVILPLDNPRDL